MAGSYLKRRSLRRDLFEMMAELCVAWREISGRGETQSKGAVVEIDLTFLSNICEAGMAGVTEKRSSCG